MERMSEHSSTRIEGFYHRFAGLYDLFFDGIFRPGRRRAISNMNVDKECRILEVGAGTGLNFPLYPDGAKTLGVDLSLPMLREAKERIAKNPGLRNVGLGQMNALELGFADDSFDVVYAPYVVSVVPRPRDLVAEMARVCKPGGRIVLVNHFGSQNRIGSWVERKLTPVTHHVGFRLDLPVESILGLPDLVKIEDGRVNVFKLWRLIVFEKRPGYLPAPEPAMGEELETMTAS